MKANRNLGLGDAESSEAKGWGQFIARARRGSAERMKRFSQRADQVGLFFLVLVDAVVTGGTGGARPAKRGSGSPRQRGTTPLKGGHGLGDD